MTQDSSSKSSRRGRNAVIFVSIVVAWLALDQATKSYFNAFAVGTQVSGPYAGVFDFTLVHNTGAAWGMLGDMTFVLGVFSLVVCAIAVVYLFVAAPGSSALCTVGISLVVAGGIGNAIDRFANSYVIDFIRPVFIDFPVFNVADIGVTCGIAIFLISMVVDWARSSKEAAAEDVADGKEGAKEADS